MPIQMFAMMTETSDQSGDVSQLTWSTPKALSAVLTTPASLLSIQDQVDAETMSGSSQGTRNRARKVFDSRKAWVKNTASANPMENWKNREAAVNTRVCRSAGMKVGSANTVW